jgi:hypothetical protein
MMAVSAFGKSLARRLRGAWSMEAGDKSYPSATAADDFVSNSK